ncbi:deaminated glutathione amidase [Novacetimonas sp. GS1]|uniref:deaminated glutathione amidase n=1 Tax=Novacetimonas sp. GS1 TaxID=3119990 RepID=UPI002FCD024E
MLKVALGQFAVSPRWETNLEHILGLIRQAAMEKAGLLVLPEGILAHDIADPDIIAKTAQPLDGPFMSRLLHESRDVDVTIMGCVHVPDGQGRYHNTLVVLHKGKITAQYRKLHLYDAFAVQESRNVTPGQEIPPIVDVAGFRIGLMTCYDVRFPELARRLALDGADALVLPAAWVRGPLKEEHWKVLVTARALENTCYMVAVSECGNRNIGSSMVVDPLGVAIVQAGEAPTLAFCSISHERIAHARTIVPVLQNRRFGTPELRQD